MKKFSYFLLIISSLFLVQCVNAASFTEFSLSDRVYQDSTLRTVANYDNGFYLALSAASGLKFSNSKTFYIKDLDIPENVSSLRLQFFLSADAQFTNSGSNEIYWGNVGSQTTGSLELWNDYAKVSMSVQVNYSNFTSSICQLSSPDLYYINAECDVPFSKASIASIKIMIGGYNLQGIFQFGVYETGNFIYDAAANTCRDSNNLYKVLPTSSQGLTSSYDQNTGKLTITGTTQNTFADITKNDDSVSFTLEPGTYTYSVTGLKKYRLRFVVAYEDGTYGQLVALDPSFTKATFTLEKRVKWFDTYMFNFGPGETVKEEIYLQLEKGSVANKFEIFGQLVCYNRTDETNDKIDQTNQQLGDLNNNLTNSDVDVDASFFSGFDNNTHGLTGIITSPLQLIGSITSSTCSPLSIPVPFVNQSASLPCMKEIYQTYGGGFYTLYQTITFGVVAYWVCVNIFFMVKGFKDPDSDRIEVLDL